MKEPEDKPVRDQIWQILDKQVVHDLIRAVTKDTSPQVHKEVGGLVHFTLTQEMRLILECLRL